jgi:A/G-specific adenine glycosylase
MALPRPVRGDGALGHAFGRRLLGWYDAERRPLPWRQDLDPYRRWVAEVVLQQTRLEQGVARYARFVARFPTVQELAAASEREVLKAWEGAGYYARARHLRLAARRITAGGAVRWPRGRAQWQALPGVGDYISRALASRLDGEPVIALEANGLRVAARWTLERGDPRTRAVRQRLGTALARILPPGRAGDLNEALMELGETVCRPRAPRCPHCPVRSGCAAYRTLEDPGALPVRPPVRRAPRVRAAIALVRRGDRWLVRRRPSTGLLGGLWELPGGKIEGGERPEVAVRREVLEETGLELAGLAHRGRIRHAYSHLTVDLELFEGRAVGRARPREGGAPVRWVTAAEFDRLPRPRATTRAMAILAPVPIP